jgi:hypothetical protein
VNRFDQIRNQQNRIARGMQRQRMAQLTIQKQNTQVFKQFKSSPLPKIPYSSSAKIDSSPKVRYSNSSVSKGSRGGDGLVIGILLAILLSPIILFAYCGFKWYKSEHRAEANLWLIGSAMSALVFVLIMNYFQWFHLFQWSDISAIESGLPKSFH